MFTESPVVRHINHLCVIWLHKPTNTRYVKVVGNGATYLMQGISGHRYVTDEELNDSEIWSRA